MLYVESAAFAAAYAVVDSESGSSCWIDVTWTITPEPCASMDGSSARSSRTAGIKLRSISFLHASSSSAANPPAGASNPDELVVLVRIQLGPDGKLTAPPMVLTRGNSALYMAARDGAVRAIFRGQPFDMLKPEHYDQWKDIEITFDPRDMIRG